ncbi:lytic transglycosylase domain-containing protein [Ornithinimicrobium sp. W1665]|uniref:aggregation-promoting factor C-terminal-like domain-containing protein n=2 Tax=Ornithinimicrobium sp. W1665 TaxID=3416666 RepID=UPI003CEFF2C8
MKKSPLLSERAHGSHRPRRLSGPAAAVTAGIAAGSLALAAYATTATVPASSSTSTAVGESEPAVDGTVTGLSADAGQDLGALAAAERLEKGSAALDLSSGLTGEGVEAARQAAERISERKAEERAAEREAAEAAERRAAEERAAEQAAAAEEQAAAEQAAAEERAAADQAAAEQAAADQARAATRTEPQAASRSAAREPAPEPAQPTRQPAPQPAQQPAPQPVASGDARSIARSMLASHGWGDDQWGCLDSLWMKESGWNHTAMNPSSGAYGIPQSLPGNKMATAGADWQTNPATQISWGLGYISDRYGSPCNAWAHSQAVNWY